MKKVLIITYYWAPSGGSGVQRWIKFVKYLREFGWEPIIYKPENPDYPVLDYSMDTDLPVDLTILQHPIWEPFKWYNRLIPSQKKAKAHDVLTTHKKLSLLERIAVWVRGNLFIPDARRFWIKPSVLYLNKYLSKNKIDAIISSGPPHSCHLIALVLKRKWQIPWIADFRDPWTEIYYFEKLKLTIWANNKHHQLEREVLTNANLVLGVSEKMGSALHAESLGIRYQSLTNGYDESDYSDDSVPKKEKFTLAHIGLWTGTQYTHNLFKIIQSMITTVPGFKNNFNFEIIGSVAPEILEGIETYGIKPYVTYTPYIPHKEISRIQRQMHVLLIIIPTTSTMDSSFILTGKVFECLAARRPIIAIGVEPAYEISRIINETHSGVCFTTLDYSNLEHHLLYLYASYQSGDLKTDLPKSDHILAYSRKRLTQALANSLDTVIA